jgi:hypothetical protein
VRQTPTLASRPAVRVGSTAAYLPPSAEENDVTDTDGIPKDRTPTFGAQAAYMEGPQSYGSDTDDWSGWISFAGIMMILLGAFQLVEGLVALLSPTYYLVGAEGLVLSVSFTAWGWIHLLLGVLILAAGFGVMSGKTWARVVGIVLAGLSALANLTFIAAYPMWSIIVIAIDVAVIYALATNRRGVPA